MTEEQTTESPQRFRVLLALIALGLAIFSVVLFHGAAENEFIWDDPIVFGRQLPYFDSLENVFFPPRGKIPQFGVHYYRPAAIMTYQLDEKLVRTFWEPEQQEEGRRFVYHTSVILYHGLASALVFLFGVALGRACGLARAPAVAIALSGSVLFAVHPIHVECVAWMAGRTDILCAIFFLLSGIFYLRLRRGGHAVDVALFALCATFAMLTKETGLGVVLLVGALELLVPRASASAEPAAESRAERRRQERKKKGSRAPSGGPARKFALPMPTIVAWALLAVAAFAYLSLRKYVIGNYGTRAAWVGSEELVGNLFGALGWYSVKSVYPPPQSAFVGDHPGGVFIFLGVVVLAVSAFVIVRQLTRRNVPFVATLTSVALAGIALPLFTAVRSISETPVAERYLYIPTVGVCLLVGALITRLATRVASGQRKIAYGAVAIATAILAVPAAIAALDRAEVWRNNLEFWEDAVAKAPDQGLPHLHLGITYGDMGQVERSLELYEMAYVKYDDAEGRSKALNNKASALMRQQKFEEAIDALRRALQEVPTYSTAHYNWGVAAKALAQRTEDPLEQDKHIRAALTHLGQSINFNPRYAKAHLQLGELYILIGQRDRAVGHLNDAARLEPNSPTARRATELLRRLASAS